MSIAIYSNGNKVEIPACTAQDIYSLEEQVVGRWIDGRPVYQRVIVGPATIPAGTSGQFSIIIEDSKISNNLKLITGHAIISSDQSLFEPIAFYPELGMVRIKNDLTSNQMNIQYIVFLQYTKTTDQATIELPAALTTANTQALYKAAPQSAAAVTLDTGIKTEEV